MSTSDGIGGTADDSANMVSPQQIPVVDQQVDWTCKIAEVMRDQFGLRPKQQYVMYKTPYPSAYDQIPLPHKYKVPNFTKFSGQGEVSMMEHVNRFLLQLGEVANQDALRVRLFSLSLFGSAFVWFTTLPANSILYWADLERQFHQFFYSGITELKLTDLTGLRQRNDESVADFIQRFSSWQKWHLIGSCHTLKINMHRKSLRALARSRVGWQERLDPMSLRSFFRKR